MSAAPTLVQGLSALGLAFSAHQQSQLLAYLDLLQKWNRVYNLTAVRDPQDMLTHHLLDCLAVLPSLARSGRHPQRVLDVGAGAGLPGVVLAIAHPQMAVTCVETVAKKAAFVQQVALELGCPNLRGTHARVEQLQDTYDLITARAFASLADLVRLSQHLLTPEGCWMAMKGQTPTAELAELPPGIRVLGVEPLAVPGLDAQRCLVWLGR